MLNFFIGFAFFEAGAIFGFFVAALKQAQGANAIVDTMSATVIKKHNPGTVSYTHLTLPTIRLV